MSDQSVSQRLHEELSKIIAQTEPGARLLSEPKLARQLGVSRATLREVMRTFETQGMIHRRQGSGTFVSHPTQVFESGLEVLESIETLAARVGLPVHIEDWKVERRQAAPEECRALGIEPCAEVFYV
ncbi:MAG TPA: GntR family transcriptional regulator, partial [Anaerolineales bacterium]|nr:GntR family transcriptional regulator [Anaerolineales bacterium]